MKNIKIKPVHAALDLDKSLAYHESEYGISKIGEPVWPMVEKVKEWLNKGYKITIFTARMSEVAHTPEQIAEQKIMIKEFLERAGLPDLPKTAVKSPEFSHIIDDRAYHVERNAGIISDKIDI